MCCSWEGAKRSGCRYQGKLFYKLTPCLLSIWEVLNHWFFLQHSVSYNHQWLNFREGVVQLLLNITQLSSIPAIVSENWYCFRRKLLQQKKKKKVMYTRGAKTTLALSQRKRSEKVKNLFMMGFIIACLCNHTYWPQTARSIQRCNVIMNVACSLPKPQAPAVLFHTEQHLCNM